MLIIIDSREGPENLHEHYSSVSQSICTNHNHSSNISPFLLNINILSKNKDWDVLNVQYYKAAVNSVSNIDNFGLANFLWLIKLSHLHQTLNFKRGIDQNLLTTALKYKEWNVVDERLFFSAGQGLKMNYGLTLAYIYEWGARFWNVQYCPHYQTLWGASRMSICLLSYRWSKYVHSCTDAVVMPYAVPLPQVVMCRGADITPKTHTAHIEIHWYKQTR